MKERRKRVFSGIQPSGDIHVGNYLGAVKKWVELTQTCDCVYCVVDDHAITVEYDVSKLPERTFNGVLATMACGLDPDQCTLFVQSHVPEHTELTWLFNTITPLGSLFRMTQFKDKARNALHRTLSGNKGGALKSALFNLQKVGEQTVEMNADLKSQLALLTPDGAYKGEALTQLQRQVMQINDTMGAIMQHLQVGLGIADASCGLFDYPVLQAADILLYKASLVPVGADQEQHLELCREIASRFNKRFGKTFPMVQRVEGDVPRILGLDGKQKMSKSLDNYIGVLDSHEEIMTRLKPAFTDPARIRRTDPGHPDVCNVFTLHESFSPFDACRDIEDGCRSGLLGCFECKTKLAGNMNATLAPIRDRADALRNQPHRVIEALAAGRDKAGGMAKETMKEIKDKMGIGTNALDRMAHLS